MRDYSNEAIKGLIIVFKDNPDISKKVKDLAISLKKNLQMEEEVKDKISLALKAINIEASFNNLIPVSNNPAIHDAYVEQARQLISIALMIAETSPESKKEISHLSSLVNTL